MTEGRNSGRKSLGGGQQGRSPRIDFRLPQTLAERLIARARADDLRISELTRRALEYFLDHRDQQDKERR